MKFDADDLKFHYLGKSSDEELNKKTERLLRIFYGQLKTENLLDTLFYTNREGVSEDTFIDEIFNQPTIPFIGAVNDELAIFTWLNNFEGKTAQGHFAIFKKFQGKSSSPIVANAAMGMFLNLKGAGGFLIDALIGMQPKSYLLARRVVESAGASYLCTIPAMAHLARRNRYEEANVYLMTRETIEKKRVELWEKAAVAVRA